LHDATDFYSFDDAPVHCYEEDMTLTHARLAGAATGTLVLAIALAGCSSNDDDPPATTPTIASSEPPPPPPPRARDAGDLDPPRGKHVSERVR
jgi:hypothetical protein